MTGKQYSVLVALAVVSSLVGGAVSHHLLNGRPTWAAEMDNSRICLKGKGGAQATLHTGAQGQPGLMLFDKKGKLRAMLRLLSDGSPLFGLQDKEGRPRVALGRITPEASSTPLPDRPVSSLVLFDGKENVIWQAP